MSVPVLEVALLPLKPSTDLTTGDGKRILDDTLKSLISRPGCTAVHYGTQLEHPEILQLNIGQCFLSHYVRSVSLYFNVISIISATITTELFPPSHLQVPKLTLL